MKETKKTQVEAVKDTSRLTVFTAVSTLVTYGLNVLFNFPVEVNAAIVVLVLAGLTYLDSWIHHNKNIKSNGLTNF